MTLIKSDSEDHAKANVVYTIGSVLIFGLQYLNFAKKWKTYYFVYVYLILRNSIRLLDLENTRQFRSNDAWSTLLVM